ELDDKKPSENVDKPMEAMNEFDTREDKGYAHHQSTENPPKKHFVLILGWDMEVREDEYNDKDVVDTQRLFDQVPRKELDRVLLSEIVINEQIEGHGQGDPYPRPYQRILNGYSLRLAVKHPQIKGQHSQYEDVEKCPKEGGIAHK